MDACLLGTKCEPCIIKNGIFLYINKKKWCFSLCMLVQVSFFSYKQAEWNFLKSYFSKYIVVVLLINKQLYWILNDYGDGKEKKSSDKNAWNYMELNRKSIEICLKKNSCRWICANIFKKELSLFVYKLYEFCLKIPSNYKGINTNYKSLEIWMMTISLAQWQINSNKK